MAMHQPAVGQVKSRFGPRKPIVLANGTTTLPFHAGIDIANAVGTPIHGAFAGTVVSAGTEIVSGRTGKGILIANPDGERQYYGHLSAVRVEAGQTIAGGQVIGLMGATGKVTGPHLHFECWNRAGKPIDPVPVFSRHNLVPGAGSAAPRGRRFLPLVIDGDGGHRTITELERALQAAGCYRGLVEEDHGLEATFGPILAAGYQRFLNRRDADPELREDGDFSARSTEAEQTWLRLGRFYLFGIDGVRGADTIKGVQRALNAGAYS